MDVVMPKPGRYVLAVSGGVDSMVLLDLLCHDPLLEITVAHVDHGIRTDSYQDLQLVEAVAKQKRLSFVSAQLNLGANVSEAKARSERYKFLRKIQADTKSSAVITAHHQDDMIETAIINMLRGTGRKGITSLNSRSGTLRPLLKIPKTKLINYAQKHKIKWREDSTNADDKYLRNYVRQKLVPKLSDAERQKFINNIENLKVINDELDTLLASHLESQADKTMLNRNDFNLLPHNIAREVMATWLRSNGITGFNAKSLERLVVSAKTGSIGKSFPVLAGYNMRVNKNNLALSMPER